MYPNMKRVVLVRTNVRVEKGSLLNGPSLKSPKGPKAVKRARKSIGVVLLLRRRLLVIAARIRK